MERLESGETGGRLVARACDADMCFQLFVLTLDVKKTSLVHALGIFERFLQGLMEENMPAEGTLIRVGKLLGRGVLVWCPTHLKV